MVFWLRGNSDLEGRSESLPCGACLPSFLCSVNPANTFKSINPLIPQKMRVSAALSQVQSPSSTRQGHKSRSSR
jgi:hypothetical protein